MKVKLLSLVVCACVGLSALAQTTYTGVVFNDYLPPAKVQGGSEPNINGVAGDFTATPLRINIVSTLSGNVLASGTVTSTGTFTVTTPTTVTVAQTRVELTINAGTAGSPAPLKDLVGDWVYMGEGNNLDDGANGSIVNITSPTGLSFGIQLRPTTDNKNDDVTVTLSVGQRYKLDNFPLSGTDLIPTGTVALGTGNNFRIESNITLFGGGAIPPGSVVLYYDNIALGIASEIINYDPAKLEIAFFNSAVNDVVFTYTAVDAINIRDISPNPYRVRLLTILPVTGLEVKGTNIGNDVQLDWSTLTEKNAANFYIERSSDGSNFISVGSIGASGNSVLKKTYQFTDKYVPGNMAYYRIRVTDKDGKSNTSNTIAVQLKDKKPGIKLYPNPVAGTLFVNITAPGNYGLELFNSSGSRLVSKQLSAGTGGTSTSIDRGSLPAGTYLMRITERGSGEVSVQKIVLQ